MQSARSLSKGWSRHEYDDFRLRAFVGAPLEECFHSNRGAVLILVPRLLAVFLLLVLAPAGVLAARGEMLTESVIPRPTSFLELESIRRSGYEGSVDVTGLPASEQLTPSKHQQIASPDDYYWFDGFWATGMNSDVLAAAVFQGDLIIGGRFSNAGGVPGTESIARWDGYQWVSIGAEFGTQVFDLAVYNGELYAGGLFLQSGGAVASFLARWDGTTWRGVGNMPNSFVGSFLVANGSLYVGGDFTNLGGINANRIAVWNGSSWSPMGSGASSNVKVIVQYRSEIVIGGTFLQSGSTTVNRLARWTGAEWLPLGGGANNEVSALAVIDTSLFVGGWFTQAGSTPVNRVARWDGYQWFPLGSGVNSQVTSLACLLYTSPSPRD